MPTIIDLRRLASRGVDVCQRAVRVFLMLRSPAAATVRRGARRREASRKDGGLSESIANLASTAAPLDLPASSSSPSAAPEGAATGQRDAAHFESLLSSISHDLRSPLLTISLSAELLRDARHAGSEDVALDALREGVRDLERMLDAVTTLSRAWKRALSASGSLADALAGQAVDAPGVDVTALTLAADARLVAELLDIAAPQEQAVRIAPGDDAVAIEIALPDDAPLLDGSALAALLGSLKTYAGTPIERLAAIELQAERLGGSMQVTGRRARLRLPLARAGSDAP